MGLLLLIPGVVLGLVHPAWFSGQYTVSTVLCWVGGALIVVQAILILGVAGLLAGTSRRWPR